VNGRAETPELVSPAEDRVDVAEQGAPAPGQAEALAHRPHPVVVAHRKAAQPASLQVLVVCGEPRGARHEIGAPLGRQIGAEERG
jgi:hypothetical protein